MIYCRFNHKCQCYKLIISACNFKKATYRNSALFAFNFSSTIV
uniref:Uncharacterized protein n=1 Tax=Heterorhabditis bacteriophora TaxID=37862 RepID=A0A1I7X3G5_HETBA